MELLPIRAFSLKVFIDSPEPLQELEAAWQEAIERMPLINTLKRATHKFVVEMVLAD